MKIKIEFTKKEKEAIADTFDCSLENDHAKGSKGKFGTAIYDPDGEIFINLKADFILSAVKLIKSFISPYLEFAKEWLDNIEDIQVIKADEKAKKETAIEYYENSIRKECEEYKKYYKKPDDDNKIIKESPLNKVGDIIDEILNNNKEE